MLNAIRPGRRCGRLAATTALVGAATLGVAGNAFAGSVTWTNVATGWGLQSGGLIDQGAGNSLYTGSGYRYPCNIYVPNPSCTGDASTVWQDTRTSDGSTWTELSLYDNFNTGTGCLDSNAKWGSYGAAYTHTCNGGNYQHWYETHTSSGWALSDLATGLYLDGGNGPGANGQFSSINVFTNSNYGDSDHYQRWS
ncbi:hypothetical protein EDD99_5566 [Streptomyces sp. 846.5]|nr:hypothetical protein [Streptomyces sp. 846.5]TDT97433.1 hypothetical protein EDD99_5566 [Streptomyces sp. 846.5]